MKTNLVIAFILFFFFESNAQLFKQVIIPYTATIKFSNGTKIKNVIYDISNDEIFLIKNFKLSETVLDSLSLEKVIISKDIKSIIIRESRFTKKYFALNMLTGGLVVTLSTIVFERKTDLPNLIGSFAFGSSISLLYTSLGYFLKGERLFAKELENGLRSEDLKIYCLKRQLNTQRILKGK